MQSSKPELNELLRQLPQVDAVLTCAELANSLKKFRHDVVARLVRAHLSALREELQEGRAAAAPDAAAVASHVAGRLEELSGPLLKPVVNATGIVLHTNLGRAHLAEEAVRAVAAAAGTVNLEYDVARGTRGDRDALIREDLCALTGAEDGTVVNNNAAAVLLALNTIADGREVIVSRGELIEIGGSFRIPDVMQKSGAQLREVGTTNRTHARDYAGAIGARTALLLKVHMSNYRVVGFTSAVTLADLVQIGHEHHVPVMEDLGSGALIDLSIHGLPKEPVVAERIGLGADLVTFSGDKLLGGPQAGVIVGRREWIAHLNRNPLKRALRCDKMTLAALTATLRLYRTAPDLCTALPTLRCLTRPLAEIAAVGTRAVEALRAALGDAYTVEMIDAESEIGSGALPIHTLPSKAVAIAHARHGAQDIARRFRAADPPIIGRVQSGRFLLDLRCIFQPEALVPATSE
jgi:L-seryl-tRNA(Ser) seleniumtransferase